MLLCGIDLHLLNEMSNQQKVGKLKKERENSKNKYELFFIRCATAIAQW
jgi:hypothetical protein